MHRRIRADSRRLYGLAIVACAAAVSIVVGGCPPADGVDDGDSLTYANQTDPTNRGAAYVGSSSCRTCHADVAEVNALHGHQFALTQAGGGAATFPAGTSAGVPDPPPGLARSDVSYVIGGYRKGANFVDADGFLVTTAGTGQASQWNLGGGLRGEEAMFVDYEPGVAAPLPLAFECFRCHTTGPAAQDADAPRSQENRPGIEGTWAEAGVHCEACHGPGGKHFSTSRGQVQIDRTAIFVDSDGDRSCRSCHSNPFAESSVRILAEEGFVAPNSQWAELRASGGHASFACTVCHDPHASVKYDRSRGIRNTCTTCHVDVTMAKHGGATYVRASDGYSEPVTCESCHMAPAGRLAGATVGGAAHPVRIGDTRSHIFRIDTAERDFSAFLSDDQSEVRRDSAGRAAITVDYVCLRCHDGNGLFRLSVSRAAEIAQFMHTEVP